MIHGLVPQPVPCYDFVLITESTLGPYAGTLSIPSFSDVTGGEYKVQGHIHRGVADPRLLAIPAS